MMMSILINHIMTKEFGKTEINGKIQKHHCQNDINDGQNHKM